MNSEKREALFPVFRRQSLDFIESGQRKIWKKFGAPNHGPLKVKEIVPPNSVIGSLSRDFEGRWSKAREMGPGQRSQSGAYCSNG
jgi:hypothetical protein